MTISGPWSGVPEGGVRLYGSHGLETCLAYYFEDAEVPSRSLRELPHTLKASTCLKFALTLYIFSSLVWLLVLQEPPLPASWLVTAGKMRDFWGQMCFRSTIIMPLKILIALAVFLGVPGPGRPRL